jgi:hypothetical protein
VKRYQDRPFVLLGVNTDDDAETLREVQKAQHLPWRSWWDGPPVPGGPIFTAWEVEGFPTMYLIDAKGVVRWESVGPPEPAELDRTIEQLVREAEKK